ncbi:hypothetical protein [Lachnobacterium bovis]|uniref:hypothetical protein n=1 Tax=Lachnobacterium bovis TaxID=140626 RepID=UPI0003B5137F|nr:hypothetical protein [Lachnobacterium bovis]
MQTSIKKITKGIKFTLKYIFFVGAYVVGGYIGIYLMMYCPICDLISMSKREQINVSILLISLLKILFAIPMGSIAWGIMYMFYNYCRGFDD